MFKLIPTMKFPKNRGFWKKTKIIAISKNHPKKAVETAISHGVNISGKPCTRGTS